MPILPWMKKKGIVAIQVGIGEALDRLSILIIKCEKFDGVKKVIVEKERVKLERVLESCNILYRKNELIFYNTQVKVLFYELSKVNRELWNVEDAVRDVCEKCECTELLEDIKECARLARLVYILNSRRFSLKNQVDCFFGSGIVEIKEYRGQPND